MINKEGLSQPYVSARGEILRPLTDDLERKQLTGAFLLIKNESLGREDDQIPS